MKEIRRAENAGFCFGVKQAIEKAEKAAEESSGKIYSMGSLIHNERVTEDLKKKRNRCDRIAGRDTGSRRGS